MKNLTVILAMLFTLSVTGPAFAFDSSLETHAQVYFAIPFGGTSKAAATPRFGFSVDYGNRLSDSAGAYRTRRVKNLDFQLNIAGEASVYSNGVNLTERLNALYAADGGGFVDAYLAPLAVISTGIIIFVIAKEFN